MKQFGRKNWVNLQNPSAEDRKLALQGLNYTYSVLSKKPFLLVLDEINLACAIGLLRKKEVLDFLDAVDGKYTTIYLTGRNAPKYLLDKADYVNVISMRKGPKDLKGKKGIDY